MQKERGKVIRLEDNPYFKMWQGHVVLLSDIQNQCPHTVAALEVLIEDGRVLSKKLEGGDTMLFMLKDKSEGCPVAPWEKDWIDYERKSMHRQ